MRDAGKPFDQDDLEEKESRQRGGEKHLFLPWEVEIMEKMKIPQMIEEIKGVEGTVSAVGFSLAVSQADLLHRNQLSPAAPQHQRRELNDRESRRNN